MKYLSRNRGLTLTELLVASILMGIVMTGVAAFSFFIKQARDSTGKGTILTIQTTTAMHYLVQDANKAVGDNSNRGVVFDTPNQLSICFRHDVNNPASYTDDMWACYWYDAASDALWKCVDRDASGVILSANFSDFIFATATAEAQAIGAIPPANFSDCNQGSGAVKLVALDRAAKDYFEVVDDANGRLDHIDITINAIADPSQLADTMNNPTYQLYTRVSPPAHGR